MIRTMKEKITTEIPMHVIRLHSFRDEK